MEMEFGNIDIQSQNSRFTTGLKYFPAGTLELLRQTAKKIAVVL